MTDVIGEGNSAQAKPDEREPAKPIPIFAAVHINMAPIVERLFATLAERYGEHWTLTRDEVRQIAEPLEGMSQRGIGWLMSLLPDSAQATAEKLPESMQLLVAVAVVCVPRLFTTLMMDPPKPQLVQQRGRTQPQREERGVHASAEEYEGSDL